MTRLGVTEKTLWRLLAAILVLIGVFATRWNVVIGGQLMSKSLRGFTSFTPPLFGLNGLLTAAMLMVLPFILLAIIVHWLPHWQGALERAAARRRSLR